MSEQRHPFVPEEVLHSEHPITTQRTRSLVSAATQMLPPSTRLSIKNRIDKLTGRKPIEIEFEGLSITLGREGFRERYYVQNALRDEFRFAQELITQAKQHDGRLFIDVGASIGLYSILAHRAGMRVVGIEPDPAAGTSFMANLKRNKIGHYMELLPFAASDKNERVSLYTDGINGNEPTILTPVTGQQGAIEVTAHTLDYFARDGHFIDPAIMKIDVEGAEMLVLKGGSKFFKGNNRPQHLFIEIHTTYLPKYGSSAQEVWEYITHELGYNPVSVYERRGELLCHFEATGEPLLRLEDVFLSR